MITHLVMTFIFVVPFVIWVEHVQQRLEQRIARLNKVTATTARLARSVVVVERVPVLVEQVPTDYRHATCSRCGQAVVRGPER